MLFQRLRSTIGRDVMIEPDDVRRIKAALVQTGDCDPSRGGGIDGTPDHGRMPMSKKRAMIKALAASNPVGALVGVIVVGQILWESDGLQPVGVCEFEARGEGRLPLNPNAEGSTAYSCTANLGLFAFSAAFPALLAAAFTLAIGTLRLRAR